MAGASPADRLLFQRPRLDRLWTEPTIFRRASESNLDSHPLVGGRDGQPTSRGRPYMGSSPDFLRQACTGLFPHVDHPLFLARANAAFVADCTLPFRLDSGSPCAAVRGALCFVAGAAKKNLTPREPPALRSHHLTALLGLEALSQPLCGPRSARLLRISRPSRRSRAGAASGSLRSIAAQRISRRADPAAIELDRHALQALTVWAAARPRRPRFSPPPPTRPSSLRHECSSLTSDSMRPRIDCRSCAQLPSAAPFTRGAPAQRVAALRGSAHARRPRIRRATKRGAASTKAAAHPRTRRAANSATQTGFSPPSRSTSAVVISPRREVLDGRQL